MKTLTKKQKAAVMAYAITFGYFDYFDCVDWKPHLHKYRYACAGDERVHYVSQKQFASDFDKYIAPEDKQDLIDQYFKYCNQQF